MIRVSYLNFSNLKQNNESKLKAAKHASNISSDITSNNKSYQQVPFKGIGTFFNKLVTKNKVIDVNFPQKILAELEKKEFGAYALTAKGYVSITPKEFPKLDSKTVSELIIKHGPSTSKLTSWGENSPAQTEIYKVRRGVCPTSLIAYLERGFSKITTIVDDGIQVLTLPMLTEKERNKLVNTLQKSDFVAQEEQNTIYMMPNYVPDFWYELTEKMIKTSPSKGMKLEKITKAVD